MDQVGILAKHWVPGQTKTRLAATIGSAAACRLSRVFLETLLKRLVDVADRRSLVFTPPGAEQAFRDVAGPAWDLVPQPSGDLGRRMHHFLCQALDAGADRVVLLGSDSPTVPLVYVRQAFALLRHHDVVLGPTSDGGYYLIGTAAKVPPIFDEIAWSTPDVWSQTLQRLARCHVSYATLPSWYDIDTSDDLRRLQDELAGQPRMPAEFAELYASLSTTR